MGKKAKTVALAPGAKVGDTGRYVYCTNSGSIHALFATQVERSATGCLWWHCTCFARGYFPKKQTKVPGVTRAEALAAGAFIPAELGT